MREKYKENLETQHQHLLDRILEITCCPRTSSSHIKNILSKFVSTLKMKWQYSSRTLNAFLKKQHDWLETEVIFPSFVSHISKAGRPPLDFSVSSERTKRRKTEHLRSETNTDELAYATQMSLRADGQWDAANVVKNVTCTTPKRGSKFRKAYKESLSPVQVITDDRALSMVIEAKLTKRQYNIIRKEAKACGRKIFPTYEAIRTAKQDCYPSLAISITETSAEVELQALLNHTAERILHTQSEVLHCFEENDIELALISKWGCDGSSGQSEYKQKFHDESCSDANIFFTSFVPILLHYLKSDNSKKKKKKMAKS